MEIARYTSDFLFFEIDDENISTLVSELPLHKDYYQILWLKKGILSIEIDFVTYELNQHTLIFVAPCQIIKLNNFFGVSAQLLKFTDVFFISPISDRHMLLRFSFFCPIDSLPLLQINSSNTIKIEENMKNIIDEFLDLPIDVELLSLYTYAFLLNTQKLFKIEPGGRYSKYMSLVLDFKQLVDKNYRTIKGVSRYADLLAVSPKYLNEACKIVLNSKATEVLSSRMILEAKRLLAYSNMGISEVAWHLNFNDLSYFAKYFRKLSGQSPTDFRLEMENSTN